MCPTIVVVLALAVTAAGQEAPAPLLVGRGAAEPTPLPAVGDVPAVLADLEVPDGEVPKVLTLDVTGDGVGDWLVESPDTACGTGGCTYVLVDGRSARRLGEFFGSPLVVEPAATGSLPVVEAYQHLSADTGALVTYRFYGAAYRAVSREALAGEQVTALFERWERLQRVAATGQRP
jgi:hypothetical protein